MVWFPAFDAVFPHLSKQNAHQEMCYLALSEKQKPSLDGQYYIFRRRHDVEELSLTRGGIQRAALMRVAFERHQAQAKRLTLKALAEQSQLWQELLERRPRMRRLRQILPALRRYTVDAEREYKALLTINNRSVAGLRSFASFLMTVANDIDRALLYSAEADRVEDQAMKVSELYEHRKRYGVINLPSSITGSADGHHRPSNER